MDNLNVKKGNPIILSDTRAEDIDAYRALQGSAKEVSNVTLHSDKLIITFDGKKKSFKYPANPSLFWALERIKAVSESRTITENQIETLRLRALAKKNGLL